MQAKGRGESCASLMASAFPHGSSSLVELEKGIQGLVVMSTDLEEIFNCIFDARVPPMWERVRPARLAALRHLEGHGWPPQLAGREGP